MTLFKLSGPLLLVVLVLAVLAAIGLSPIGIAVLMHFQKRSEEPLFSDLTTFARSRPPLNQVLEKGAQLGYGVVSITPGEPGATTIYPSYPSNKTAAALVERFDPEELRSILKQTPRGQASLRAGGGPVDHSNSAATVSFFDTRSAARPSKRAATGDSRK